MRTRVLNGGKNDFNRKIKLHTGRDKHNGGERETKTENKMKIKSSLQIILQAKILDHLGEHNSMKTIGKRKIGIEIHFKI